MEEGCKVTHKPRSVKEFFSSWYFWKPFIGVVVGGIVGFLYYHFVGCVSGTCAITSNPYRSTLFGAVFGFLLTSSPCLRFGKQTSEK
jgi:hypothetical protein